MGKQLSAESMLWVLPPVTTGSPHAAFAPRMAAAGCTPWVQGELNPSLEGRGKVTETVHLLDESGV